MKIATVLAVLVLASVASSILPVELALLPAIPAGLAILALWN